MFQAICAFLDLPSIVIILTGMGIGFGVGTILDQRR